MNIKCRSSYRKPCRHGSRNGDACASGWGGGFAASDTRPGRELDRDGSERFLCRDQGSRIMPLRWIAALKQPNGEPFMAASLSRYGYLPNEASNPPGLPVGFTVGCRRMRKRRCWNTSRPFRIRTPSLSTRPRGRCWCMNQPYRASRHGTWRIKSSLTRPVQPPINNVE